MNKKQTLAVASTSVLAASMAHGAVIYTPVDMQLIADENQIYTYPFDLDGVPDLDGPGGPYTSIDFIAGFDNHNGDKPFIDCKATSLPEGLSNTNGWTLSNTTGGGTDWGAALTGFATPINADYAAVNPPQKTAYLYHDGGNNTVGNWPPNEKTDGYVGLAIISETTTNFGYAHLIYDGTANPKTLTFVGYGYETEAGKGIVAGAEVTPAEPVIYTAPISQTVGDGDPVQFKVRALADPAPTYQWQAAAVGSGSYTNLSNDGHFSGVDTDTLSIDAATGSDNLDFQVVVANALGNATSTPAAQLTVLPPVLAGPNPSEQRIFQGLDAQFDISTVAGVPTGYQWRKGGVNLADDAKYAGTASRNLTIKNLTGTDSGSFDVVVDSNSGATTSSAATLTAIPADGGAFEAATLAQTPKIYYRLNETVDAAAGDVVAYDNAGGKNGIYGTSVQNGGTADSVAGPRPADGFPGFASANSAVKTIKNDTHGFVKTAPWLLNTNAVTISAWIKPASEPAQGDGVVTVRNTQSGNVCGMAFYGGFGQAAPYGLGYNWNDQAHAYFWDSGIYPPTNVWSFVALVVTPTNASVYMIHDDLLSVAVHEVPSVPGIHVPQFTGSPGDNSVYIGGNMVNPTGGNNFDGAIDEVSVFNYSLSQDELIGLYSAARGIAPPVKIKIEMIDSQVVLTWASGTLLEADNVTGPWTPNAAATSPYTNAPTGLQKFYKLSQ